MKLSRNRWIVAAGVVGAAVAVVATGTVAANAAQEKPAGRTPVAATQPSAPAPLGAVVDTGFAAKTGSWVIYAVPVDQPEIPGTKFGVMTARKLAGGTLAASVTSNEFQGSDKAPGFHAVQAGMEVEGEKTLSFGYYVGDAEKITASAGGRTVTARQAAWSKDAAVKFFWFDPATPAIGDLKAFDAAGRALPAGNTGVGVG